MDAHALRKAFTEFWESKGHLPRPSASLIPHDPTLLFTVAGMVPFKPYFLGEEEPPGPRLTTIQKCVRAGGKHNDLDDIGRTNRHFTFFEMMGNFSFGDYFKPEAIPWAWEFVTETLGLDPERLWITVHLSDDDAERIWIEDVGVPAERVTRLDEDNWWAAGDTGPCGPCSEIFYDLGPEYGEDGGPGVGSDDRFVEIWNLVFMQYERNDEGELEPLPKTGIDTGAGLERMLTVLQGVDSAWDIDIFVALLDTAQKITGVAYGEDPERDVSLRIFADHARAVTFLISDGVFPSNEDRGYVLRRIIRRAVRHAWVLGVQHNVMPQLVDAVVDVMGAAYPDIVENQSFIREVVEKEETRFRRTLAAGVAILDEALEQLPPGGRLPGEVAFKLHDTYGFPVEITEEILSERGLELEREGFESAMAHQREQARAAGGFEAEAGDTSRYRELQEQFGPSEFLRDVDEVDARILAVYPLQGSGDTGDTGEAGGDGVTAEIEIVTDRTPFYPEGGGQVGDTGVIVGPSGAARVVDTDYAVPGVIRHRASIERGTISPGEIAHLAIDADRRAAVRRNHTGTHILHWALRQVLGAHVKQAGSHVDDHRLRFDFSHFDAVTPEELARIEDLANAEILSNEPVLHYETTMDVAREKGAIAFFGDKYGDVVRVLEAGSHSIELCGGTHVRALGDIGHLRITSESSIGSNLRRIEAITGMATVSRLREDEELILDVAQRLGSTPEELGAAVERRLGELKELKAEIRDLSRRMAVGRASELVAQAVDGVVVARVDSMERDDLRELALAVRDSGALRAVVLGGVPEAGGVALVAAVDPEGDLRAADLLEQAARTIQGGFGRKGNPPVIMAGGRNAEGLDEALDQVRSAAGL
ncbi:MAG TPA: alanine--tRNA ligase [Acidimicrobiales bacterium]|nr:alanine--tRNA ligase [Acidimicrobiales bacterium]